MKLVMERESASKILPLFLFLLLLSLSLILAGNLGFTRPIVSSGELVAAPLKESLYRTRQGLLENLEALRDWQGGAKKVAQLEEEIRQLQTLSLRLAVLEEENKALRRQLEAPLPPTMKFLPAKTLGLVRFLTIDKGEEDGVKEGMMVVSENILVGKVAQVMPKTSQVLLPTDPDSKIPSRTLKTSSRGLAVGEFGTKVVLDKVLQAEMLESGDLVVTDGGGEYPRDLLIGKLGVVEKKEVEPFQRAEIIPLLDYGKLVNVFVLIK